ncbi:hypothetical protein HRbin15_00835 [bacterium HR15]|nr:hypothetical protein HRbin15_00835 [bacterium HR15]
MRRGNLRWVRQMLAQKGTAKAFAALLCVCRSCCPRSCEGADWRTSGRVSDD